MKKYTLFYKSFFEKVFFLLVIAIYIIFITILSPVFFVLIFIVSDTRSRIIKRFFPVSFKNNKKIVVHASSAGEAILAYNLFEDKVNYTFFNEGALQIFEQKGLNCLPLPFESLFSVLFFIFFNHYEKLIIIEQEIWPCFLFLNRIFGKKIVLLNSNMYEKSYKFQKKFKFLFSNLFSLFHIILAKSEEDKDKLLFLNKDLKVENLQNFKILSTLKSSSLLNNIYKDENNRKDIKKFKIILFSSFHLEEFQLALDIISRFYNQQNIKFIIAPRHINKIDYLIEEIKNRNISYNLFSKIDRKIGRDKNDSLYYKSLFAQIIEEFYNTQVIVVDKYGILSNLYRYVDLAVIGGSFNKKGGQNFIEALFQKTHVIIGPSYENFYDLIAEFEGPWLDILENAQSNDEFINYISKKISLSSIIDDKEISNNLELKILHIKKIAEKQNKYIINLLYQ